MMSMPRMPSAPQVESDAPEPRGARHAALLLHAMSPVDRNWVLDALPAPERANLLPLLAELEALGIESDPALIGDATSGLASAAFSAATPLEPEQRKTPMSDEALLNALNANQVQALIECLRLEPPGLVAEWLRLADWSWREELLGALEPAQRRKIEASLAAAPSGYQTPPGMRALLISGAVARLREHPVSSGDTAPWSKFSQSLRQMLGGISLRGRFGL